MAKSNVRQKLQAVSTKSGSRFSVEEVPDYNKMPPLFSLERVQSGEYCFSNLQQEDKANFADAIFKRKSLTWAELQQVDRHGLGHEKISRTSIKPAIPKFITAEEHNLLAFRFSAMKPMVGYRVKNVFYVLWFDHDFTVYSHG